MKTYTNPQFPGKTFRRLEVGEEIQDGDYMGYRQRVDWDRCDFSIGESVREEDYDYPIYREIHAPEPTTDPSAMMLQRIEQKLDAVLAKLNG